MSSISVEQAASALPERQAAGGLFRYRFANVEFDEAHQQLTVAAVPVTVEPLPLQLLAALLRRPDEILTRGELFEALWQGRPTVDHVLANAVSKLRRALGEEAGARLLNVPRLGYRLVGPIERFAVGRRPGRALNLASGQPVPGREDYLLDQPLGDGTASAVWRARHKRLHKVRVFKFAGDGEQLAALKREFTVHRLLLKELGPRADLVALDEANFADPPFFLAYEDAGLDLRRWAAGPAGQDALAALGTGGRLALFLEIAQAVAAAHSVGVLHRDLKPGNVLITEQPGARAGASARWQVRLTDFGSSRLLDPDRLAALGVTAMGMTITETGPTLQGSTPSYLAPELLSGESATTRSDLYALGLMLYQLLVGNLQRPLATGWEHDIGDPLLVADVRAATEGRPERRLASVAQLIERLEALPQRRAEEQAQAENRRQMKATAERLRKIRSRRPWLIALSACIALGGLGAGWFAIQARAAQHEAERSMAKARSINDFLNIDILQAPEVMHAAATPGSPMFEVLNRASDRASERFSGDRQAMGQVRVQLSDIFLRMGFLDQAETRYRRVLEVQDAAGRADEPDMLAARFGLAQVLGATGRAREALAELQAAERQAGGQRLAESSSLAQRALRARVQVLMDSRRHAEALADAERLVQLSDAPSDRAEADLGRRLEAREWLYEIYLRLNDGRRAAALLQALEAPPFKDRLVAERTALRIGLQQAHELIRQDGLDKAEQLLARLHENAVRTIGPDDLIVGRIDDALFLAYQHGGRFREALEASNAAARIFSASLGEQHSQVTLARIHGALAELDLGHAAEALRELQAARARLDANGLYRHQRLEIDLARARALTRLGRPREALDLLQDLSPALRQDDGSEAPPLDLQAQAETGLALMASGSTAPGRALLAQALQGMQRNSSPPWVLARYKPVLDQGRANPAAQALAGAKKPPGRLLQGGL